MSTPKVGDRYDKNGASGIVTHVNPIEGGVRVKVLLDSEPGERKRQHVETILDAAASTKPAQRGAAEKKAEAASDGNDGTATGGV